jgi:hypothetical protein
MKQKITIIILSLFLSIFSGCQWGSSSNTEPVAKPLPTTTPTVPSPPSVQPGSVPNPTVDTTPTAPESSPEANAEQPPNILFIIMDDVGVDQMALFGYGGSTPPPIPTINAIAESGVRFHNTWSMPACSTSRSTIFTGRFPSRTNVLGALGPDDLSNSMVSPYEQTMPKLLKTKNYESALFGKFHLQLQGNSPYGYAMPHSLGWDYFYGWFDETGDPSSIDTTAGGIADEGTYTCGYVTADVANVGACYQPDGSCQIVTTDANTSAGRACRDSGGILDPLPTCQDSVPSAINFETYNSYFVNPLGINYADGSFEVVPPTDSRARVYRATASVDAAIDWINAREESTPWMATLSFTTVHTPLQPPPADLISSVSADAFLECNNTNIYAALSNQMLEAMDHEIERFLIATNLATQDDNGTLVYDPQATNTMIIIVGDNGTLGYTVKLPFQFSRAKGTAYQTGVWVPLVVAGVQVEQANRDVNHMTNIVDIYTLVAEIAGIDVTQEVTRPLDAEPLMPYITNPSEPSIRTWNYTEIGQNIQINNTINGPCQFVGTCSHIPVTKTVCEDNGGVWWGEGNDVDGLPAEGLTYCCEVQVWKADHNQTTTTISPDSALAIRNDDYKLVRNIVRDYNATTNSCQNTQTDEFYAINENIPMPELDYAEGNLLDPYRLTDDELEAYNTLLDQLDTIQASFTSCSGDGNLDLSVNYEDLLNWEDMSTLSSGRSSWYDINHDGITDLTDEQTINANIGISCQ